MIILQILGEYLDLFVEWNNQILTSFFTSCSGALGGRLCIDAFNVRRLVGGNLSVMVQCTATLLCGITIAMSADWKLTLVILIVIPLMGLQGYAQVKFLQGFSQDAKVSHELPLFYGCLFSPMSLFFPPLDTYLMLTNVDKLTDFISSSLYYNVVNSAFRK